MSVDVQLLPQSKVELAITVEPSDLVSATEKAYSRFVQQVVIPGFRKGKAPRAMVERAVGQEALVQEAVEIAVSEAYTKAMDEHHLQPLTQPEINLADQEEGAAPDPTQTMRFKATVVVQPSVTLGDYHDLRVAPPSTDIGPDEIDQVLSRLQQDQAPWQAVDDQPAEDDNQVTMAIKATIGEETLIDQESFEYVLRADESELAPIPQLSAHLNGSLVGQTIEYEVTLPEGYQPQEYVGQTLRVVITVSNIERKSLPDLDDEFARSLGNFDTLEGVREAIKATMAAQKQREVMDSYVSTVIDQVVARAQVDLPEVLVEQELERMMAEMRSEIEQGRRMTLEQYLRILGRSMDDVRGEMQPTAEARVRSNLVLDEIGRRENINPPPREVDRELLSMASLPTLKNRDKRRLKTSADVRERIAARMRRRYVILHLLQVVMPPRVEAPMSQSPELAPPEASQLPTGVSATDQTDSSEQTSATAEASGEQTMLSAEEEY